MLNNISFTDHQGTTWTDAVIRPYRITEYTASNSHITRNCKLDINNTKAALVENDLVNESATHSISVEYAYWGTQAAYDNDLGFYWLAEWKTRNEVDTDNNTQPIKYADTNFHIDKTELEKAKYAGLTLEAIVELYLQDEILPNL